MLSESYGSVESRNYQTIDEFFFQGLNLIDQRRLKAQYSK